MSNRIHTETEEIKPKSSYRLYLRVIAVVLVVALVGAAVLNRPQVPEISDMQKASMAEEGTEVVVVDDAVLEKLQALEKVKKLQKELNEDYQNSIKYIEAGEYEKAIPLLEKLLQYLEDDETVGAYLRASLCELYFTTGRFGECAESCDRFAEKGNDTEGSYRFMGGIARMQVGEYEQAAKDLEASLEAGYSETGMAKAQIALANVYLGDYEKAMAASQEALAAEHDESLDEVLHYINGIGLLQAGSYEEGAEAFTTLIETSEPNGEYYYYRGVANMALEKYSEGKDDYAKALELGYADSACWYNYGICAIMLEDYETGLSAMEKVVELNEDETYISEAQDLIDQMKAE